MSSELKVNTITEATSGSGITFAKDVIPATPLSHRNMIINGAMQMAQRGTSSTVNGYGTVDRFRTSYANTNEAPTQTHHALTSSDTGPYEEGFRYSFHITNGNNSSDHGDDRVAIIHLIEAQDIANSGWDYTSSSSYITLSFWCKSSVAQNFYGRLTTEDGTQQNYPFETGSLTANTWTKITKTIPGNSNLQFDNNTDHGLTIEFTMFRGTNKTGTLTLDAWGAYNSSVRVPDMTSTWYTTNDATWEITGVQLERGQVATPFEHRSYADELARCQRYYWKITGNLYQQFALYRRHNTNNRVFPVHLPVPMRHHTPTITNANLGRWSSAAGSWSTSYSTIDFYDTIDSPNNFTLAPFQMTGAGSGDDAGIMGFQANGYLALEAEL